MPSAMSEPMRVHQDTVDSLVKRTPAMKSYLDAAKRLGKFVIVDERSAEARS